MRISIALFQVLLLCIWIQTANASVSFVQVASRSTTGQFSASVNVSNVAQGNALVVSVSSECEGSAVTALSDSKGNFFSALQTQTVSQTGMVQTWQTVFFATFVTAGTTTITASLNASICNLNLPANRVVLTAVEYAGVSTVYFSPGQTGTGIFSSGSQKKGLINLPGNAGEGLFLFTSMSTSTSICRAFSPLIHREGPMLGCVADFVVPGTGNYNLSVNITELTGGSGSYGMIVAHLEPQAQTTTTAPTTTPTSSGCPAGITAPCFCNATVCIVTGDVNVVDLEVSSNRPLIVRGSISVSNKFGIIVSGPLARSLAVRSGASAFVTVTGTATISDSWMQVDFSGTPTAQVIPMLQSASVNGTFRAWGASAPAAGCEYQPDCQPVVSQTSISALISVSNKCGLSGGAIAGIVVGCVVGGLALAAIIVFITYRQMRKRNERMTKILREQDLGERRSTMM